MNKLLYTRQIETISIESPSIPRKQPIPIQKRSLEETYSKVERILRDHPETRSKQRNVLLAMFWAEELGLPIDSLKDKLLTLTSAESVTRMARVIQNDERRYQPSIKASELRQENTKEIKRFVNKHGGFE